MKLELHGGGSSEEWSFKMVGLKGYAQFIWLELELRVHIIVFEKKKNWQKHGLKKNIISKSWILANICDNKSVMYRYLFEKN